MLKNDDALFGRIVTAMATPFEESGSVDYSACEILVNHLIANRTDTILVAGTTGESPTLSSKEKTTLLKKVIEFADGRVKVICGSGSNNTESSIAASLRAEANGASGLLIVAPYYNKPSQDGIVAHIKAVSDKVKLPILVYNIPGRTGINIEPKTMLRLIEECPQVKAIKDSAGNMDQTADLARQVKSADFRIYSGDDNMTLPMVSLGACGVVSVASHIIGEPISEMIEASLAGKLDIARSIHYKYLPVFKGLFQAPNPTCLKYVLAKMGIIGETLRLPLVPLTDDERKKMDLMMEEACLLSKSCA